MILQNYLKIPLMDFLVSEEKLQKIYKPNSPKDWSGIRWHGNGTQVPKDSPTCGWNGELCHVNEGSSSFTIIATVSIVLAAILLTMSFILMKRHKSEVTLKEVGEIIIEWDKIHITQPNRFNRSFSTIGSNRSSDRGNVAFHSNLEVYTYQDKRIIATKLCQNSLDLKDRNILICLKEMREIAHDNVNSFVGLCNDPPNVCYLMAYCRRGSLQDIISDVDIALTRDFKISFILDIASGLWYLHQSPLGAHGRLTSARCVVDNRWTCKVTGHGFQYVREKYSKETDVKCENSESAFKCLWMAPELLKNPKSAVDLKKADVYSFAIICSEIFTKDTPYGYNEPVLEPREIINKFKEDTSGIYRPHIPFDCASKEWISLIQDCWLEDNSKRPNFIDILIRINSIHKYKSLDLIDNMIKRLERHTHNLEERVEQRCRELEGEKAKVEMLLSELLPASVAKSLISGMQVPPESFDDSTIFFSDIVGFTRISSMATPMDIVIMLNCMYTMFDDVAQRFDVYKVATIGDAYMVASGVPIRNGSRHASEICRMALALRDAINHFVIPHNPSKHLLMRSGVHSGPCVAGVCGLKMPRYLLFGDTIDIAAQMESNGQPMRVHISETTELILSEDERFDIEFKGKLSIKGKESLTTYWITQKEK